MQRFLWHITSLLIFLTFSFATPLCMAEGKVTAAEPLSNVSTRVPDKVWKRYTSPEEAGWSSKSLKKIRDFAKKKHFSVVMIIYDGAVVDQWGDTERRIECHSIRKSFLGALYGIHVARGDIDINKTLKELNIDDEPPLTETERTARVIDLLKSKSGVYHSAAYETDEMKKQRPKREAHAPGEYFWYNNWDFNALGTIFEQETGKKIREDFYQEIATPLQMQDFRPYNGHYQYQKELSIHPAYPFQMSTRDLARFGLLYLRKGRWGNKPILPKEWINASVTSYASEKSRVKHVPFGYGNLWWVCVEGPLEKYGMYSARGFGGHSIVVLPAANLVIVHRVNSFQFFGGRIFPKEPTVPSPDRIKFIELILKARTGNPKPNPRLVPVEEPPRVQSNFQYDADFCKNATGRYDFGKFQLEVMMEEFDGQPLLLIRQPPKARNMITPISKTEFRIEDLKLTGSFGLDKSGKPKTITIHYRFGKPRTGVLIPDNKKLY